MNEDQQDEMLALASIYQEELMLNAEPGSEVAGDDLPGGVFAAPIELPEHFKVMFYEKGALKEFPLHFLPPVTLYFQLPPEYPAHQPPTFTLSCMWLTLQQLSSVCAHLDELWRENAGSVVLFTWISFLQNEILDFLGITSPIDLSNVVTMVMPHKRCCSHSNSSESHDNGAVAVNNKATVGAPKAVCDPRAVQDIGSERALMAVVMEYDAAMMEKKFDTSFFSCQVCLQEKVGAKCMQFVGCGHVFCRDCMCGFFEVLIRDGSVNDLVCPEDGCNTQANPRQVELLVSADLFARYDRLLLQASLDTMSDVMYCPRRGCGCVVIVDQEGAMGTCPTCFLVFCMFCRMTYHGVNPCELRSEEMKVVREAYIKAKGAEKTRLERRYGRVLLQQLVEESYSEDWLKENSKRCPRCSTHIQKIDGCNKMTCTKCRSFFCWLCGSVLSRNNPYAHFITPGSPCFHQLFEVFDGDELEDEDELEPVWID